MCCYAVLLCELQINYIYKEIHRSSLGTSEVEVRPMSAPSFIAIHTDDVLLGKEVRGSNLSSILPCIF